jgi:hypothetical protein
MSDRSRQREKIFSKKMTIEEIERDFRKCDSKFAGRLRIFFDLFLKGQQK